MDEIVPLTDLFFSDFPELTEAEKEVMAGGNSANLVLEAFKAKLEAMSDEGQPKISSLNQSSPKETGIKGKNTLHAIRIAVSGEIWSELPGTIYWLGREKSINIEKCWKRNCK